MDDIVVPTDKPKGLAQKSTSDPKKQYEICGEDANMHT